MKVRSRVFSFALLSGVTASVVLLLAQVLTEMTWRGLASWFMTPNGLANFVAILILAVLPASIPMTLVGGCIAGRMAGKQQHRRLLWFWIARGCFAGFALAALGSALWFGGGNAMYAWNAGWDTPPVGMVGPGRREMLEFVSFMTLVGGVFGTFVGGAVGAYCWHVTRGLPPNPSLNPTVAKNTPAG